MSNQLTKLDNHSTVEESLQFAGHLIESKMLPKAFNTAEKVFAAITQGKELGFDAMTSLNNINVIQGKPTLSVHAIAALVKRSGVSYKIKEDYAPVTNKEGKVVDYRTTITFYEKFHNEVITQDFSFTWTEAAQQELLKKDNWKRMPKIMMRARCLALGARFVAPDALMGLYETAEAAEFSNVKHTVDDEGNVQIIDVK